MFWSHWRQGPIQLPGERGDGELSPSFTAALGDSPLGISEGRGTAARAEAAVSAPSLPAKGGKIKKRESGKGKRLPILRGMRREDLNPGRIH